MESWALSPQMMQTNVPGVFAAGDAVTFPLAWRNNRKVNIPHWQMAHAQGMASSTAGWEVGRCPRVSASPSPTLKLLTLGPGCRAIQSSVVTCLASLIQVMKPTQRASPVTHLWRPPSCALWIPHSASHSAPPHLSFHQPLLFFCPQRHAHQGERDLVGHSSPLSASVSFGPLD